MNSRSPAVTFILIVAAVLIALALAMVFLPLLFHVAGLFLALVPFLLLAGALYSCLVSPKPTNIKFLWILIVILAPFLGPLLWFFWGKRNT